MASHGIRDRVAIVGMGCTPFGEHWDKGADDLLVDSTGEAYASAGVEPAAVDAYWLGTMGSGVSGLLLSEALKIQYKPVTRLENMCATGSEALRNAAYAVASGAYDLVMAVGVEKLNGVRSFPAITTGSPTSESVGTSNRCAISVPSRTNTRCPGPPSSLETYSAAVGSGRSRRFVCSSGFASSDPM